MSKQFALRMIRQLAAENDLPPRAVTDYQVEGFTSIVLHRSDELNIRLYVSEPGKTNLAGSLNPDDNTLWIHDHRFTFQCETLIGKMGNLLFEEGFPSGSPFGSFYKYKYYPALGLGRPMILQPMGETTLSLVSQEMIRAGESYSMDDSQLHKIWVPDDRLVAMLFWEYRRLKTFTYTYSKVPLDLNPDTSNLYTELSEDELHRILDLVCENL